MLDPAAGRLDHGRLQKRPDRPAAEDDVEDGHFAVPAVQRQEGADREQGGVGVDHRGFHDFDGDGGDQPDYPGRHAQQEIPSDGSY